MPVPKKFEQMGNLFNDKSGITKKENY